MIIPITHSEALREVERDSAIIKCEIQGQEKPWFVQYQDNDRIVCWRKDRGTLAVYPTRIIKYWQVLPNGERKTDEEIKPNTNN